MKTFVVILLLTVCAAAQAGTLGRSPAITLLEYYKTNRDVGRIISGQPAKQGQFPWQAGITVTLSDRQVYCGGSLISPRWVLTAGHCVHGALSWSIKFGGIHRSVSNEPGSVVVSSRDGILHENYNIPGNLNNDIALIRLNEEIPLSEYIQLSRLPALSEVNDRLENIPVTVSGWGLTSNGGDVSEDLNWVNLNTITNDECANVYGPLNIIESTLCCRGHPEHSTCSGDSGGPLIRIAADGQPTQVGVVSFVHGDGCTSGNPSGFVRTASFLTWINKHTGIPIRP